MRPAGLEPATLCFEGIYSVQLSYGRVRVRLPNLTINYSERQLEKPSLTQSEGLCKTKA